MGFVRFFCSSLDSADCVSEKASSQPLDETAVREKVTDLSESDCSDLEGQKLVDTSVAHNSSDQIPDGVTVFAGEEPQSFKTGKFTRTISPPTLGTLRSCFSWSGSLGEFSDSPRTSPTAALQRFRRKGDSPSSLPKENKLADVSQSKSDESSDESQLLCEVDLSSQSQKSIELSPHSLNASELPQPSSKDSNSEVSQIRKPCFQSMCKRK